MSSPESEAGMIADYDDACQCRCQSLGKANGWEKKVVGKREKFSERGIWVYMKYLGVTGLKCSTTARLE